MAKISTDNARSQLAPRGNPYYADIGAAQLVLGYRKNAKGGKWVVRRYIDGRYESETLGIADDDGRAADGVTVLTYGQAMAKARQWGIATTKDAADYSVGDALADYFKALHQRGKNIKDAQARANRHVVPVLGSIKLRDLNKTSLQQWLYDLGNKPRTVWHARAVVPVLTAEDMRKRRASANRIWATLQAALNHAFREDKVASDSAWRRVTAFEQVDVAKIRHLDDGDITRFLNAAEPSFRKLASGALLSGARYGELCRLSVQDFDGKAGTLHIRTSKSGKERHVFLTDAGVTFFDSLTVGRAGDAVMFANASGEPWIRGSQNYPQRRACLHAKLKPFGFHILRHTYGAQCVMGGMPLQVLAQNLGHSTTRMTEKHYAHLTSNFVRDTVRQFAPSFGITPD